jgi:hypothetical protein
MRVKPPFKPPFRRKSTLHRLADTVSDQLAAAGGVTDSLATKSRKAAKTGLIAAGGVAGLTAGSAAISSLRHRGERDHAHS